MRNLLKITLSLAVALLLMAGVALFTADTAQAQNNSARIEQVSGSAGLQGAIARQEQTGARGGSVFIRQLNSPNGPMEAIQDQAGVGSDAEILQNRSVRAYAYQEQDGNNSRAVAEQIDSPDATSRQFQYDNGNYAEVSQRNARRSTARQEQFSAGNSAVIIQRAPSVSGGPTGNTASQIQN